MVTGGRDRSARLWHSDSHRSLGRTLWHPGEVTHVAFHPTRQGLTTIDPDQTVRLWELKPERVQPTFESTFPFKPDQKPPSFARKTSNSFATPWPVTAAHIASNGEAYLILAGDKVQVRTAHGRSVGAPVNPRDGLWDGDKNAFKHVTAFAIDEDNNRLITDTLLESNEPGSAHKLYVVQMWNLASQKLEWTYLDRARAAPIWRFALSKDGKFAAAAGMDKNFLLWSTSNNKPIIHRKLVDPVYALAISLDSKRLVMGNKTQACIYDLNAPTKPPISLDHPDAVVSAAFHPTNSKMLLTGFVGGALLWDLANLDKRKPLQHLTGVFAVGFSRDGETLVTAGQDTQARLWDSRTLKGIGPPVPHSGPVYAVGLTANDKHLNQLVTVTFPPAVTVQYRPLTSEASEDARALATRAELMSNIHLDDQNTVKVLPGPAWSELRKTATLRDDWESNWRRWTDDS